MAIKTKSTAIVTTAVAGGGSSDWEDAPDEITRRHIHMDIYGPEGTGRTSLALSAPGPVALINADEKIHGITQPHTAAGKRIRIATFGFVASNDLQDTANRASVVWNKVVGWSKDSRSWARSCIHDTSTETWEVLRLARFGTLKPEGRMDNLYGPVNAEYRGLHKEFRLTDTTNLITIHQVKEKYKEGVKDGKKFSVATGTFVRAGMKEVGYWADVVIRTGKRVEKDGTTVFTATIEKGWYNAMVEGTTFESTDLSSGDISFPTIMELITGKDASEWR